MTIKTPIIVMDEKRTWTTREPEDDGWDNGETSTDHNITGLQIGNKWHDIEVPFEVKVGDELFLVVVNYSTGSTFGRADGQIVYVDAFKTSDEALKLLNLIGDDLRKRATYDENEVLGYYNNGVPRGMYTDRWKGYFERFNSSEVYRLKVKK